MRKLFYGFVGQQGKEEAERRHDNPQVEQHVLDLQHVRRWLIVKVGEGRRRVEGHRNSARLERPDLRRLLGCQHNRDALAFHGAALGSPPLLEKTPTLHDGEFLERPAVPGQKSG